ncbi:MAG: Stp1/IreP family PP2C-type Ser/Thr phosphatase [Oscillospiraceae bacterium]|jgi:protein phosphatase|nr:Stp1/IreP family PP2C-type Ser/Thr phosphatase [Oscillospiraceae bacterium]
MVVLDKGNKDVDTFVVYGGTNIGKKRLINQDAFAFGKQNEKTWIVVCDGLGGENAGEVASKTAVDCVSAFMKEHLTSSLEHMEIKKTVIESVERANEAVLKKASEDERFFGMSTTIVSLIFFGGLLHIANVGDSRAYCISNGIIEQLTKDHSVVQVLIDSGKITKREAKKHPSKNCLIKVLGLEPGVEPSYTCRQMSREDKILVCTDGLHDRVIKKEMVSVLEGFGLEESVNELINIALKHGGADNITAVLMGE